MEFRLDLRSTLAQWPDFADENISSLGEGWVLAQKMVELHSLALQRISKAAVPKPTEQDEAVLLLGVHGLNLFMEFMGQIARGRYDVASHLMRAILDCQSLAFPIGGDASLAHRFLEGDLRAAEGRKLVIETMRPAEQELAEFLEGRFKEEAGAANDLSHINMSHLDKVIERSGDKLVPIIGGRSDAALGRHMTGAALEHEHWHLTWLKAFRKTALGTDWQEELEATNPMFRGWMKDVFGASGYNADTNSWDATAANGGREPERR